MGGGIDRPRDTLRSAVLSVHGSGRVCPGSDGTQSMPPKIDSEKPAFMLGAPRLVSSSFRGSYPQALTLLGGAKFIA